MSCHIVWSFEQVKLWWLFSYIVDFARKTLVNIPIWNVGDSKTIGKNFTAYLFIVNTTSDKDDLVWPCKSFIRYML